MPKISKVVDLTKVNRRHSEIVFRTSKCDALHLEIYTGITAEPDATAKLYVKKPNGKIVSQACDIYNTVATIDVFNGATDIPGVAEGIIKITDSEGEYCTPTFRFAILDSFAHEDSIGTGGTGITAEQAAQIEANRTAIQTINRTIGNKNELPVGDANIIASINRIDSKASTGGTGLTSEQEAKLNSIDNKVDKINGKGLSTNDYTTEEKATLSNLKTTVGDTNSGLIKDVKDLKTNGVSQDNINSAIENYLTEHPVASGATAAQAAQIEANRVAIGDSNSGLIKEINNIKNTELQNLNTAIQTLETLVGVDETLGDKSELPVGDANIIASINRIDSKPSGTVTNEQVSTAVNNYLAEHPVSGELTAEQEGLLNKIPTIEETLNNKADISMVGTPLVADSTSNMTDTSKIYVNTADGNWYYHNGSVWTIGGIYNSEGIGRGSVKYINLSSDIRELLETISIGTAEVVDEPPTIATISNLNAQVNVALDISYTATDDNGINKHEFSIDNGSSYTTITPTNSNNVYTFSQTFNLEGTKTCKIRVTDTNSQVTTSNSFTILVSSETVDNPPVISMINNVSGYVNGNIGISYTATDDGEINKHEFSSDNGNTYTEISPTTSTSNTYSYSIIFDTVGTKTCKIRITDNGGNTTESNPFTITVNEQPAEVSNTLTVTDISSSTGSIITKINNTTFEVKTSDKTFAEVPLLKLNGNNLYKCSVEMDKGEETWYSIWISIARNDASDSIVIQMDEIGNLKYWKFGTSNGSFAIDLKTTNLGVNINSSTGVCTLSDASNKSSKTFTIDIPTVYNTITNGFGVGVTTNGKTGKAVIHLPSTSLNNDTSFMYSSLEDKDYGISTLSNNSTTTSTNIGLTSCGYNIPEKIKTIESRITTLENRPSSSGSSKVSRLYNLRDAFANWYDGEKFPIAFYGDSTTDGNGTTSETTNAVGTDITDENGNDTQSPNAYPQKLQELLREETGNNALRIYNAGYSAKTLLYGIDQYENCFVNGDFSDAKMIGIRFGINDAGDNGTSIVANRNVFRTNLVRLINKIIADNKQPFLVTTQPFIMPQAGWKMKDAYGVDVTANEVYREVAEEYGLEILDIHDKLAEFLTYSQYQGDISTDRSFHFKDVGHLYTAGLLFKLITKRVIDVNPKETTKIDYTSQKLGTLMTDGSYKTPVTSNMLNFTRTSNGFNCYVKGTKSDNTDSKIFDAYVFNNGKELINIKAYVETLGNQYVKIDGEIKTLTGIETDLGNYDLGLHHLEVFTGESTLINFSGFKIS